ncbi:hypothetical protein TNIN_210481 [Trichonephila inaurata madagascariensis]|uniref:Uncharacterized protein n=1 Tax=Trichonephila inaurata madagascariensis TaxID=2747483 RepID=A0A8X6XWD7_9ARAC|nr:hypothetical protein TNIN_210481 [Trichonephila inaurata madagascariensis]
MSKRRQRQSCEFVPLSNRSNNYNVLDNGRLYKYLKKQPCTSFTQIQMRNHRGSMKVLYFPHKLLLNPKIFPRLLHQLDKTGYFLASPLVFLALMLVIEKLPEQQV